MNLRSVITQYAPEVYLNLLQNFDRNQLWMIDQLGDLRDKDNSYLSTENALTFLSGVKIESFTEYENKDMYPNPHVRIVFKLFGHGGYPGGETAIDFGKVELDMDLYAFMMLIMFESNLK